MQTNTLQQRKASAVHSGNYDTYKSAEATIMGRVALIVVVTMLWAGPATLGKPLSVPDISRWTESADVIAMGVLESFEITTKISRDTAGTNRATGSMMVTRTLKGRSLDKERLVFDVVDDEPMRASNVQRGETFLVFLREATGRYEVVDPDVPALVVMATAIPSGATPLDRVLDVVADVVVSNQSSEQLKRWSMYLLRPTSTHPVVRNALRDVVKQQSNLSIWAAATLVAGGDVSALETVEKALMSPNSLDDELLSNLRGALSHGNVRGAAAAKPLERLLASGDAETRRAAIFALVQLGDAAAIAPLVRALDDDQFFIRATAMRGLASLSGQPSLVVSDEGIRSNEGQHLQYWRTWAEQRR